jgi:nucleoid-associated protein YgaU
VTGPEAAELPAAQSLSLNTIRRAVAALLGGSPEPTDPAARKLEPQATAPGQVQDLAKAGESEVIRPSFDIVRVEPSGRAVIAGRAAPGADVELMAGERVLDRVRADRRGEWVATPTDPLPAGGLELALRASSQGAPAVHAEQVVVVVVPEPPPPQPAPIAAAEGPPPQPAPVAGAEGPPPQPPELRKASGGALAVLLTEDGRAPGRILQAPGRISSEGSLALLMLDYDDQGRTRLTGEAPPGAPLRIYVDNQPAAEAIAEPSGRWAAVLEHNLAPGQYTLRLDQLGSEGRPVARLETPFTRVSQPPIQGKTQVDYVIVQPGNSLWRIARRLFGSGMEFVQIHEANKTLIRDPDLIYPGQVFEVPSGAKSSD